MTNEHHRNQGIRAARRKELKNHDPVLVNARVPAHEQAHVKRWLLDPLGLRQKQWAESLLTALWCSGALATQDGPYVTSRALAERSIDVKRAMDLARAPKPAGAPIDYSHQGFKKNRQSTPSNYLSIRWSKGLHYALAESLERSGLRTPSRLLSAVWFWSQSENREVPVTLAAQLATTIEYWSHALAGVPWDQQMHDWQTKLRDAYNTQNIAGRDPVYTCTPHSLVTDAIKLEEKGMPFVVQEPIGYW